MLAGCSKEASQWSAFEQCMLGGPLPEGENVFLNLRGIQLAEGDAGDAGDPWPARCVGHAKALHDGLGTSGAAGMVKRSLAEQLDGCEPGCKFPEQGHVLPKADELWARARQAKWEFKESPDVSAPKQPLRIPGLADFPPLAEGYDLVASLPRSDALWLLFRKGVSSYRSCRLIQSKASCSDGGEMPELDAGAMSLVRGIDRPVVAAWRGGVRQAYDLQTGEQVSAFGEMDGETYEGFAFEQQEQVDNLTDAPLAPRFTVASLKAGAPGR